MVRSSHWMYAPDWPDCSRCHTSRPKEALEKLAQAVVDPDDQLLHQAGELVCRDVEWCFNVGKPNARRLGLSPAPAPTAPPAA